MKAFNCNDRQKNWTNLILSGEKKVETRNSDSLASLVGKRVGVIQTGKGKAKLVGYVTISDVIQYKEEPRFRHDEPLHRVPSDLKGFEWGGAKFGYVLSNPARIEPITLPASCSGIVIRNLTSVH
jgi:hypothetical protein